MTPLDRAIEIVPGGRADIAKACSVTKQAVQKWQAANRLPRSEFSGETEHAGAIETATGGMVTQIELLEWSRAGWIASSAAA